MECTKTYLTTTTQDPHCLNCKKAWKRDFLNDTLSKNFVAGKYKTHRENVLWEREKALLPETIPYVERYLQVQSFNKKIKEMNVEVKNMKESLEDIPMIYEGDIEHRVEIYKTRNIINNNIDQVQRDINLLKYHLLLLTQEKDHQPAKQRFVRACPADGCRGFLSSQWKCGLCDVRVCAKCHEIKGSDDDCEHECKEENVATAELLKKDTKPCPKCAALIFKIDGCSQMWCVQCHTTFDWRTGQIETDKIHNPHYYEYLRSTNGGVAPREIGDVPCGGLPDIYHMRMFLQGKTDAHAIDQILSVFLVYHHVQQVELPLNQTNVITDNRELRIKYLANEIDEIMLKRLLRRKEKINDRKKEVYLVLELFLQIIVDITQRLLAEVNTQLQGQKSYNTIVHSYMNEYDKLRDYLQECMQTIANSHNTRVYCVNTTLYGGVWYNDKIMPVPKKI